MITRLVLIIAVLGMLMIGASLVAAEPMPVGVASVDITPDHPVRLNGYGFRRTEHEGVDQRIFVKALAIGSDRRNSVVILTADQCIVPATVTEAIAQKLQEKAGLPRERFVLCISHSHTTPMLTGASPTLFSTAVPPEHQANIDRYTQTFIAGCVEAAMTALADRKPATLAFGIGKVAFAANRRTPGGPVDHDLPVLVVRAPAPEGEDGGIRAIWAGYACHTTTVRHNRITGDWAGYAQQHIENAFPGVPGATALISIGAGADANPPRDKPDQLELPDAHGRSIADEVQRMLNDAATFRPVSGPVTAKYEVIELPFDTIPTREQWQQRIAAGGRDAYHAAVQLRKLDGGEKLRTHLKYPVQTFTFSDDLAIVFLGGELVVDYALRLKREFDPSRLWVNGYCNAVECYIPSERVLAEGGYEGGGAMLYYDQPTRFAPGLEKLIIDEVHDQLPPAFTKP